jgi:hypothetical protein
VDVAVLVGGNGIAGRADALLDETAIRSYRRRAGELTAALTRTDIDPVDAARLRTERDAISAILRSGTGRYGKSRAFPDSHERARTAVRKALVRALAAITAVEPDFGHHLAMSLTTGATCRYTPGETWKVTVRTPVRLGRD